jgi:hypothetical protein
VRELLIHQPIFIGFKMDNRLREMLETPNDSHKKYVSAGDSTFLRICMLGEDRYVGKLVDDRLTTDRVEDIRRHILSIIRKIGYDVRMPTNLRILACSSEQGDGHPTGTDYGRLHADPAAPE